MKIKRYLTAIMLSGAVVIGLAAPSSAAVQLFDGCEGISDTAVCKAKDEGSRKEDAGKRIQDVINTVLYILGIVAIIMIVIGGFRYITSNGDSGNVTQGKNTILYACIGLVIAIMSYGIVNFIIFRLQK